MSLLTELISQQITFETYAPSILGDGFSNVKLLGVMDADSARLSANIDPRAMHESVFALLPAGSAPDDHRAYSYAKIQYGNGAVTAIGIPWIIPNTIRALQLSSYRITIAEVKPEEIEIYTRMLRNYGANVVSVDPVAQ